MLDNDLLEKNTYATEFNVLLACARTDASINIIRQSIIHVGNEIDWKVFCLLAQSHGVIPLCYQALIQQLDEYIPLAAMNHLHHCVTHRTRTGLLHIGELRRLSSCFAESNIPFLCLKGPALGLQAYTNPTLREYSDLDLLVHVEDLTRAQQLLLTHGYVPENPKSFSTKQVSARRRTCYHEAYLRQSDGLMVELHWKMTLPAFAGALSERGIWERCHQVVIGGYPVYILSPEDQLLYLCIHGAKHQWFHLKWLCDVAELLRSCPSIDWEVIQKRAGCSGNRRVLLLGLYLAHGLLDAPVPASLIQQAIIDDTLTDLATTTSSNLMLLQRPIPTLLTLLLYQIQVKERFGDRLHLFLHNIMTPGEGDWDTVQLPSALTFLYTIIRPARLIKQYGGACIAQVCRR